ncbi:uncharacterized protein LOC111832389 [Capsella rubella]|uniref:uncharacterized protein LOC111832389 n=1 Tax=Capsella rubella TaxID=81985 RepID=UPI000CD58115|nr:uncharacterized protein LOC111832389 [Capsella rubella]
MTVDFNGKMDAMYTDLNGKIEALSTYTNKLETLAARTFGVVKKREGCNVILIRDGDNVWEEETSEDDETALAQQMSLNTISRGRSTLTPVLMDSAPDGPISTAIDTTVSTPDHSVDRHLPCGDRHPLQTEPDFLETLRPSTEKIYKPKVPFPRPRKSKQEMEEPRFKAMMAKVINEIRLDHAYRDSPMLKRCVKRMVQNDVSPEEGALLARDMGAIFLKQTPQSINLIPYSVAVRLGMTDFKLTRISLILANKSKRIPEGVLEDVLIRIGECIILIDFLVFKYSEEPLNPLILGRSFLATAGALIDVLERNDWTACG